MYADDANMNFNAANAAMGAEWRNAQAANNDAWAGNRAAAWSATPQYYGAGPGFGLW